LRTTDDQGGRMKKLTALVALALLVIGASQFVATGGAAQERTITKRVAALEKKVRGLQATTSSLKKRTSGLEVFGGCLLSSAPIAAARYTGYVYTPDNGTTYGVTTALDATDTGDTPQAYIVTINPSCLGSAAAKNALMRRGWRAPRALSPRAKR
jgi:cell division protein FtsB